MRRVATSGLAILAIACTTDLGGRSSADAGRDASSGLVDAGGRDAVSPGTDAFTPGVDAFTSGTDAFVAPVDTGPTCTPAYDCTSCCGPAPDGCGHTLACDACVDDVWCAPGPSRFAAQVQAAVQSVMDTARSSSIR